MRRYTFVVNTPYAMYTNLTLFELSYYAERHGLSSEEFDEAASLRPGHSYVINRVGTITRTE